MCYLSVFFDPKSLCLQQASTFASRFVDGKQLHLTFCFVHQISDNIHSLLVTDRKILGLLVVYCYTAHATAPIAKLSLIATGTCE